MQYMTRRFNGIVLWNAAFKKETTSLDLTKALKKYATEPAEVTEPIVVRRATFACCVCSMLNGAGAVGGDRWIGRHSYFRMTTMVVVVVWMMTTMRAAVVLE